MVSIIRPKATLEMINITFVRPPTPKESLIKMVQITNPVFLINWPIDQKYRVCDLYHLDQTFFRCWRSYERNIDHLQCCLWSDNTNHLQYGGESSQKKEENE